MHSFFLLVMDCSLRDCWQRAGFRVCFLPPAGVLGNKWGLQISTGCPRACTALPAGPWRSLFVPLSYPLCCPLSFRVRTFPKESHLGHDTVRALMYYALKVWSDITPLNFHEVAGNNADIQIDFSKADHNDGYPFDGPGGTVAHAFFPGDHHTAGDTHFDDDEYWTFRSSGWLG